MNEVLRAADLIREGQLDAAHAIVQDIDSPEAAYWHGILHRAEGDYWNSKYWFRQAKGLPARLGVDAAALTDAVEARGADQVRAELDAEYAALRAHCEAL